MVQSAHIARLQQMHPPESDLTLLRQRFAGPRVAVVVDDPQPARALPEQSRCGRLRGASDLWVG